MGHIFNTFFNMIFFNTNKFPKIIISIKNVVKKIKKILC